MSAAPPQPPSPGRAALLLVRRIMGMGRWRVLRVTILGGVSGLAEGVGILALVPILKLSGLEEDGAGTWTLPLALGAYVLLIGGGALIARTRTLTIQTLSLEFLDSLRRDLHAAILRMEWSGFRALRLSDLQQAMTGEIGRIGTGVIQLGTLSSTILTVPFVLGASLILSWPLTLAALAAGATISLAMRRLGTTGFLLARDLKRVNQEAMSDLVDDLAGLRIIKGYGAEERRAATIAERFAAIRHNQIAYMRALATERATMQTIAAAATAIALFVAVRLIKVPPAEALVLILAYARMLQVTLRGLSSWRQLTSATAALETHDETLALCRDAAEPTPAKTAPVPRLTRALRLNGVSTSYATDGQITPALTDINAEIPAGKITALIGRSGAGKSTLTDLIAGLTVPDRGQILIDDTPLTSDGRAFWRQRVAIVPQDPFLFHDTIAANLTLARPDASEADLWHALEASAIADVVRALPEGLQTVVGTRGMRLSGGERQRIVLARALLRRPEILVLDEATASLDGQTEQAVARTLDGLRGQCTTLIVAHRPSTVHSADHILVLDAGQLISSGSWEYVRANAHSHLVAMGMSES